MVKHSVVLIEDNFEDIEVVRSSLSEDKYTLNIFEDGADAWDFLKSNAATVDVVILAKTLPNISGMEILLSMHSHAILRNVPVIMQTVDTREGKYKNAIESGANFYLNKPLDPKKITALVKASIRTYRQAPAAPVTNSFVGALIEKRKDL